MQCEFASHISHKQATILFSSLQKPSSKPLSYVIQAAGPGSSVRKKRKAPYSSYGCQDINYVKNLRRKSGKQTSEPALDQGTFDFHV